MAAKLAGLSVDNRLSVSDRFYAGITDDKAGMSCGCPHSKSVPLWTEEDVSGYERIDFDTAYPLGGN